MKTIDLSDLKAGDKAWSCIDGLVEIIKITEGQYPLETIGNSFSINGLFHTECKHPTLFHSEQEFREYWGLQRDIDAPLTKREQFAMAAMQGLLANGMYSSHANEGVVDYAIEQADALLTKLNEKNLSE